MSTQLISIVMPVYNGGERIAKAIESVFRQSHEYWELLIIDDGSSDNTRDIVENFAKLDDRIKYIKNEKNVGIQKTLNRGLSESKGEYIARIDDDDVWIDRDKLKKQIEVLEHSGYVLVGTGVIVEDETGKELFRYIPPQTDREIRERMLRRNCFAHSSVLFKRDKALNFGGYSESIDVRHIEDYDLWLKLGTMGKMHNLGTYSIVFTQRQGSISTSNRFSQAKRSLGEIWKFKGDYPGFLQGSVTTVGKLIFALVGRMVPINQNTISKIKSLYKES